VIYYITHFGILQQDLKIFFKAIDIEKAIIYSTESLPCGLSDPLPVMSGRSNGVRPILPR
jgi:hypothetical protein